jgi:hypothetical protein
MGVILHDDNPNLKTSMPSPCEIWHWQEAGTAWKGVGIYHVTLTIPSRQPLLGTLPRIIIRENNRNQPQNAKSLPPCRNLALTSTIFAAIFEIMHKLTIKLCSVLNKSY